MKLQRAIQGLALLLILLSIAALAGSRLARARLRRLRVDEATLYLALEGLSPRARLVLRGHNPLPLPIMVRLCELKVRGSLFPATLELAQSGSTELSPGDFKAAIPMKASGQQLLFAGLAGLLSMAGLVDLQGELEAGVGPLRHRYLISARVSP